MSIRKAIAWAYGSQAFTFTVSFVASVAVTRLLSPREIGIYAIAMATSAIVSLFTSFSIQAYIVREGELDRELVRSVYSVNTIMNIILAGLLFLIGWLQATVFGSPEIGAVLILNSVVPLIGMWQFVPTALYQRELNYSILSRVGMIGSFVTAAVTVWCAYTGFGPKSPIIGAITAGILTTITYNVLRYKDIVIRPTFKGLKPIVVFGFQIMSVSGVAQLSQRLSDIALGRALGLASLGVYSRASNIGALVFNNVYGAAAGLVFAKLSLDLRERGTLHETFVTSLRLITAAMWPIMIGLAIVARPTIYWLYGERWLGAAAPLSILMVAQFVTLGFGMNWELFVLRRETARQSRFEALRAVLGLALFSAGAVFSIAWAAVGRLMETIISYFMYRPHMDRLAGTQVGELEAVYVESLILTTVAVIPALVLMVVRGWAADTSPFAIAGAVALGVLFWLILLMKREHPLAAEIVSFSQKLKRSVIRR